MLLGIDHLVIVVRDLDRAAKDYERLGFTVIEGGRHPVGSYNVLIPFADGSYLEIISFYREAVEHRWWAPLQKGERLVDFCMRTDDLMGDTAKLRAAGVAINDPVPWSRTRPDGYELRWLLALATGPHRGVAPFLIEDLTPREERVPQTFEHANGATGIATVTIGVEELSPVIKWYESALGTKGNAVKDTVLNAAAVRFRAGDQVLHYVMPDGESGPLARWLREYGPSPYAAAIRSSKVASPSLDLTLTHGAKLSLEI